jgi:hypothetical protein
MTSMEKKERGGITRGINILEEGIERQMKWEKERQK